MWSASFKLCILRNPFKVDTHVTRYLLRLLIILTVIFISFQCGNMAREGLRTLVVAKRVLTEEQYQDFEVFILIK